MLPYIPVHTLRHNSQRGTMLTFQGSRQTISFQTKVGPSSRALGTF